MTSGWTCVSKDNPCGICQKKDWCARGEFYWNCMRVPSDQPAKNGNGWLHRLGDTTKLRPLPPKPERPVVTIDAPRLMRWFSASTRPEQVEALATSLGVSVGALVAIGAAWAEPHRAFAFPMKDAAGNTIGIRLRDNKAKWAVKGSRAGLIYAEGEAKTVVVLEGPTDTAAAMTIGLSAIGRPSCLGQEEAVDQLLRRKRATRAIICSDNDEAGYRGAEKLQQTLSIPSVIFCPPAKDMRELVRLGGTIDLINALTGSLVWHQPKRI